MKQSLLILISLVLMNPCLASTFLSVFAKYPNPTFVETGTCIGDGVQMALDAGFRSVYSVELSKDFFASATERFARNHKVHLYQGNSGVILYKVIKRIKTPITFWLDGHYSGGTSVRENKNTVILDELTQIKKHRIKTHTILIDDMRCCGTWWFDFISKEAIIKKIKEINPKYTITYEDGAIPGDVLVARVLKKH